VAAIAIVVLLALQALPGLMRPPAPPPLDADVGLPRATPHDAEPELHQILAPKQPKLDAVRRRGQSVSAATAVISSKPRRPRRKHRQPPSVALPAPEPPPAPAPTYSPPAALTPPPPAPTPAGDGSEEFAPH